MLILIDTSVWIDFINGKSNIYADTVAHLIETEQSIATCGLIYQEFLQGISDEKEKKKILELLNQTEFLSLKEPVHFIEAAHIYSTLKKKGHTLKSTGDCLIAALALDYSVSLLQKDSDYSKIAEHFPLKLFSFH